MRPFPKRIEVVDDDMAAVFRAMTGARRLQIASDLLASARRMLWKHLADKHPEWTEKQVKQEAARRISHGAL